MVRIRRKNNTVLFMHFRNNQNAGFCQMPAGRLHTSGHQTDTKQTPHLAKLVKKMFYNMSTSIKRQTHFSQGSEYVNALT